jgi:phosphoenolpyruvate synthase/pyruvate phosphate dikinase
MRRNPAGQLVERDLLEIAFYRTTPAKWSEEKAERDRAREKEVRMRNEGVLSTDNIDALARRINEYENWYSRTYNDIVAWVRVIWDGPGPAVKGYAFKAGVKASPPRARNRFQRGFRASPFLFGIPTGKVFEAWFSASDTDESIFTVLRDEVVNLGRPGKDLARRHPDLQILDSIGHHLPWRRLIGLDGYEDV